MIHLYLIVSKANFGQFRPTKADWLKEKNLLVHLTPKIITFTDFIVPLGNYRGLMEIKYSHIPW